MNELNNNLIKNKLNKKIKNNYFNKNKINKNNKFNLLRLFISLLFNLFILIINFKLIKNNLINYFNFIIFTTNIAIYLLKRKTIKINIEKAEQQGQQGKEELEKKEKEEQELNNLISELKIKEEINNKKINEINNLEKEIKEKINIKKEEIKNNYLNINLNKINNINNLNNKNNIKINLLNKLELEKIINNNINNNLEEIKNKINYLQNKNNNTKIKIHSLELEKNNIIPKLENLSRLEEELKNLEVQYEEINFLGNSLNMAIESLEKSYEIMKKSVTPKFTGSLSQIINKCTNGKYKNINFNDEKGLIVELPDGSFVNSNVLSIGTIYQMYLGLRIAVLKEITEENMPIILDEPFVYYDNERLKETLKYIKEELKENQILIFTCNNREINILEKENIEYNLVEI